MELVRSICPISKEYIYDYVLSSTISIFDIKQFIILSLNQLLHSLFETIISFLVVIFYVSLIVLKISVIIFPHLNNLKHSVITFHQTQLTRGELITECVILAALSMFLIFRKSINRLWKKIELSVSSKFRKFISLLPHILFFSVATVVSIVGQKFLVPFTSPKVLPAISLIIPTIYSVILINQRNWQHPSSLNLYVKLKNQLLLWVVLGLYHSFATISSVLPFSSKIIKVLPLIRELSLVILVWAQLSPLFTQIVFDASLPALKYIASKIPSSDLGRKESLSIFQGLRYMNVINRQQEVFLVSLFQDGIIMFLALFFICLPYSLAYGGAVIVVFVFPIFRTYACIDDNNLKIEQLKNSNREVVKEPFKSSVNASSSEDLQITLQSCNLQDSCEEVAKCEDQLRKWLRYWALIGLLWINKIYSFSLWPSIIILVALWLQHSYFDGAKQIFSKFDNVLCTLRDRDRAIKLEKEKEAKIN